MNRRMHDAVAKNKEKEAAMSTSSNDKRSGIRIKKEVVVGVRSPRTSERANLAYTIDLSRGGMKIGSPVLYLSVGEQVELLVDKSGGKALFSGTVARKEGTHYIDRISRSGNAFFVRIEDVEYHKFVRDNFFIY